VRRLRSVVVLLIVLASAILLVWAAAPPAAIAPRPVYACSGAARVPNIQDWCPPHHASPSPLPDTVATFTPVPSPSASPSSRLPSR
jgi:hypothetical protein